MLNPIPSPQSLEKFTPKEEILGERVEGLKHLGAFWRLIRLKSPQLHLRQYWNLATGPRYINITDSLQNQILLVTQLSRVSLSVVIRIFIQHPLSMHLVPTVLDSDRFEAMTVSSPISYTGSNGLTCGRSDVIINAAIDVGSGTLTVNADDISISADLTTTNSTNSAIYLNAGKDDDPRQVVAGILALAVHQPFR